MLKQSRAGTLMATTLALAVTAQNAKALDFTFSFDNVNGNTAGPVSGIITGLVDNQANQAATSVIIQQTGSLSGSFEEGNDAVLWAIPIENEFSVTNGLISDASFTAGSGTLNDCFMISSSSGCSTGSNISYLTLDGFTSFVEDNSSSTLALSPVAATPVPFGVIPDTGLGILAGIWVFSRLRLMSRR